MTFIRSAVTQRWAQTTTPLGKRFLLARRIVIKVRAPSEHRKKATPNGARNPSDSFIKRNEQPHARPTPR
jgi:hypothetical protein